ncbi:Hypothetical protein NTJ_03406 [Nesidiocoris tenuis]|uniref:Uncharacterized protein n=1 Tax=Nesidiocoris tenuis TaxID=355587 RepID=A0ABN7AE93_9HEMI|nr:Hypothetical protein NTJ_03406 [Nesidiocoris tenuis]
MHISVLLKGFGYPVTSVMVSWPSPELFLCSLTAISLKRATLAEQDYVYLRARRTAVTSRYISSSGPLLLTPEWKGGRTGTLVGSTPHLQNPRTLSP